MMRHALAILVLLLFAAVPGAACAQQAWLLLAGGDHGDIYRAEEGGGVRHVARVGNSVTYGETESALAVISRRTYADPMLLQIFDKKTEKTIVQWPLPGFAVLWLSGPSRDVALTDKFAYYVSIRYAADGRSPEPNELGGNFDLYRVALADGKSDRFPLSPECANPRVVAFAGSPVVYSWNGSRVWVFDSGASPLEALALRDVADEPSPTRMRLLLLRLRGHPGRWRVQGFPIECADAGSRCAPAEHRRAHDARSQSEGQCHPHHPGEVRRPACRGRTDKEGERAALRCRGSRVAEGSARTRLAAARRSRQHHGSARRIDHVRRSASCEIGRIVEGRVETLWTLEKGASAEFHYPTRVMSLQL